jgi:coenzyme PQQ precursor peptide PqqA
MVKYSTVALVGHEELRMEWTTPDFVEIELNCEINSYANAEL